MASGGPAMLSARNPDAFYLKLQDGHLNWLKFCSRNSRARQIAFLGGVHEHVIIHLGTHGQISAELPRTTPLQLDTSVAHAGKILYPDGPARFKRFELPGRVQTFTLYEGAVAPGVCFSDEQVSFKTMMAVLTRSERTRSDALVKSMDIDPKSYDKDPDYEINLSNVLVPHRDGFYKHHWKARVYTRQAPLTPTTPMEDRRKYPILKRLVTTVSELKTADIRLLEWHIVAFMIHDGVFYVIDLNPYIFPERLIKMAHLRSGVDPMFTPTEQPEPESDVRHRKEINATLYASTNTEKIVRLFSKTRHISCVDSTCSVLRVEVPDGMNGNDIDDGSADGVIDSIDIRRFKLTLRDMLDLPNVLDYRQDISNLIAEILRWYTRKGIVDMPLDQFEVIEKNLSFIREVLTTVNDESIWIKPTVHPTATAALMQEIYQYMGEVIDPKSKEYRILMNWLKTYMNSGVRKLAVAEKKRLRVAEEREREGLPTTSDDDDDDDDDDEPDSPTPHLDDYGRPVNASSFGSVVGTFQRTGEIGPVTRTQLLDPWSTQSQFRPRASGPPFGHGGKIKKSNKKQHKKYKNTRKERRRTNKNKKKRDNKTNKKKTNRVRRYV